MLRPGGFIEYSPKEQKLFDLLHKTIEQNFASYGYQHIHTPAVESVDVLKKGGDEVSKQIFGLTGLENLGRFVTNTLDAIEGIQDAYKEVSTNTIKILDSTTKLLDGIGKYVKEDLSKGYALHFDLTVPFARYVLDRQNELSFPFKRYQMQPVWRGERSQKGRYKEFRQSDIDVIWKTKDDRGYNAVYDADCVVTLATTLRKTLNSIGSEKTQIVVRYNNKAFMMAVCGRLGIENTAELFGLLDKYYKLAKPEFDTKLAALLSTEQLQAFSNIRDLENNHTSFPEIATYIKPFTDAVRKQLGLLEGIEIVYDPSIVRGLDYYTGTVFETFVDDRKELGSVCSGGAYANLTEFLDPKQSFSGIGGSIGLSRLMSILVEDYKIMETFVPQEESYLVIHEEKTADQTQDIVTKLRNAHKIAELYPLPDKIDKQFKYAEKKGITYIVQVFPEGVKYKKVGGQREIFS